MRAGGRATYPPQTSAVEIVRKAVDEFGRIDVLVNNAAHQMSFNAIEEISDEEWEKTLSTNISAMFYIVKSAVSAHA